ncbi:CLUMA_CG009005, isoform A [Clunio marinus]|uniref:CLUMA_CG009005, isoform A n=1 Tax=Clunio marinus TaxID=568069 RepID=A0A1J1I5I0_9DIPT|nr:CLUMA_CG009005, isoform A [Clunio marinus]
MKTKALVFGLLACSGVGLAGYQLYKTYLKTMEKDEVEDQKERTEKEEDEYIEDNDYQPGEFERIMNEWEVDNEPFWKRRSFPSNGFDLDLWQPIAEEDEENYEEDESEEDETYETCEESEEESYETCQEYENEGDLIKDWKLEQSDGGTTVNVYLDSLSERSTCFYIDSIKTSNVGNLKDATIECNDYYLSTKRGQILYNIPIDVPQNQCNGGRPNKI